VTRTERHGPARHVGRILRASIALVAASVMLSGCLYAAIPENVTSSAPTIDDPTSVDAFYAQDVSWSTCGSFECAMVAAPLDWEDPAAGSIGLSVIRSAATGPDRVGSLLTNPGGPGASGVALVRDSLDFAVGSALQESYDIIGFDPRGVGESTAVRCFDAADMDAYLYDLPANPRGSAEWEAELTDRNKAFADACEANSQGILPFVTTINAARDMDLLRAVLGDDKMHYLGYSYGTFLGATYAELYPENVGRMVLDGAIDPSISGLDVGTEQAIGFENALRAYMADCLTTQECPFRGSVDQAMADLGALLASVDRTPLPASDGRELGADSLVTGIIAALYSQANWPILTQALNEALQGDPETAFRLADFYNGREGGAYADNSAEAFRAYNCMDYPVDGSQADQDASDARIAAEAPTIAPYWAGPDACEVWPYEPTGMRGPIAAAGAAPILVVGTTGDPATPYAWSVALAEQLESGTLVTNVGEGHTGYNKGNACVDDAVEAYLIDGTVPPDDLCS
jgi:pimeloyl-ACP methyl ester carboxylesterase